MNLVCSTGTPVLEVYSEVFTSQKQQMWSQFLNLDYFQLKDINADYKSLVQDRGCRMPSPMCTDQVVIDAMNIDIRMREIPYGPGKILIFG
jgi:hypothetical protein